MSPSRRGLVAVAALALAPMMAPPGWAQEEADEAFTVSAPDFKSVPKAAREVPSRRLQGAPDARLAPQVALSSMDNEALLLEDALRESGPDAKASRFKTIRISVGRELSVSARDGAWSDLADGSRLWTADVVSPGALGMRLHFSGLALPDGAELAVWGDGEAGTYTAGPLDKVAAEFHFGSAAAMTRTEIWTGTIAGERAHVEYLVPAGAAREDELPFLLDRLQHVYRDPVADMAKAAGPCHNDVSCFPQWQGLANAVAGIGTVGTQQGAWCTGQLLNISNKKPDFTPYWLTANHCLDNQSDASFAEFFWFYQSGSCGGPAPSIFSVPRSAGATLLSTHPLSDYTLLLVEGALPGNLSWAGWTAKKIKNGTPVVAIHHPDGDFKRISFGVATGSTVCKQSTGAQLVDIAWTDGPTEPGSSGSGIFLQSTGQLFGQLCCGPSSCSDESFDCYGAFASTFQRVKNLLKGGSDDKSEQNDACNRARLVKPGVLPARIVKIVDSDWYRISVKPGQTVNIDLDFFNAHGDIDLAAYGTCKGGEPIVVADGTADGEGVAITNVGNQTATLYWQVYLANDTRATYDMAVGFE